MEITANELALMKAISKSNYGNGAVDEVWAAYDLLPKLPYTKASHAGVVSSLVKKGLAISSTAGSFPTMDDTIVLTFKAWEYLPKE